MSEEFRRMLRPGAVTPAGRREMVEATPEECAALARRMGIIGVGALRGEMDLTPAPGNAIRARGRMTAEVTQACIVTLEPVVQAVEEEIDWRILAPGDPGSDDLMDDGPEEVESEPDGSVDLGEALAQQLALALDPYPRAPGAELPEGATDPSAHPFAALRDLRRR